MDCGLKWILVENGQWTEVDISGLRREDTCPLQALKFTCTWTEWQKNCRHDILSRQERQDFFLRRVSLETAVPTYLSPQ